MKMTNPQFLALKEAEDGMLWQADCDFKFIGTNNRGRHYACREALDLFVKQLIDRRGRITPAGRRAIEAEGKTHD